jgi:hypothetical protein
MTTVNSIRLQDAYLCLNCDLLNDSSQFCALCGKTSSLYPLSRFINRTSDNRILLTRSMAHTRDNPQVPCAACNSSSDRDVIDLDWLSRTIKAREAEKRGEQ